MKRIWKQRNPEIKTEKAQIEEIAEICGISPFLAECLISRGLTDPDAVTAYLEPDWEDLHDWSLLPDIQPALERLRPAKLKGDQVCIYGDYDVDGMTAAAILIKFFRQIGISAFYRLPNRQKEGYGLNIAAIRELAAQGVNLIITVDNGISAFEETAFLQDQGIDLIITDHHEWQGKRPTALAVIDPKIPDSVYPFKELCGAGIAFKLVQAMNTFFETHLDLSEYIEMAAVATIADVVPLVDENRVITTLGLQSINTDCKNKGLAALMKASELTSVNAHQTGFVLAPKMNAAGRLGDASCVVELYTASDPQKIDEIAAELSRLNTERRNIETTIFEAAVEKIKADRSDQNHFLVVAGQNWHEGVIGIVASRLQEIWYRPTIVISIDEAGNAKGSCRSVSGVNIFDALQSASDLFSNFGGHEQAAGFSLPAENIPKLRDALEEYGLAHDVKKYHIQTLLYDLELPIEQATLALADALENCEPTGVGNPSFTFKMPVPSPTAVKKMGSGGQHLSFYANSLRCVAFNMGDKSDPLTRGNAQMLCRLKKNSFRNQISVEGLVSDLHCDDLMDNYYALEMVKCIASDSETAIQNLHLDQYPPERLIPSRQHLIKVYQQFEFEKITTADFKYLRDQAPAMTGFQLIFSLFVLKECGLMDFVLKRGLVYAKKIKINEKKDVNNAPLVVKLKKYVSSGASSF